MAKADKYRIDRLLRDFDLLDTDDGQDILFNVFNGNLTYKQAHQKVLNLFDAIYM